jgi:hypothetical protein
MLMGNPAAQTIDPVLGDKFQYQLNADFVSTFAHGFAGSSASFVNSQKRIVTEFNLQTVPAPSAGGTTVDKPTQGKNILNGFMNAWNEGFSAICVYTFYCSAVTGPRYSQALARRMPRRCTCTTSRRRCMMQAPRPRRSRRLT